MGGKRVTVKWEEPPGQERQAARAHEPVALALKKKPMEWARIFTFPTAASARSTARTIRDGMTRFWGPGGSFEAVARTVDGVHYVYARYVGEVKDGV